MRVNTIIRRCILGFLLSLMTIGISVAEVATKYEVNVGDTACGIAERYKVPCSQLLKRNNLGSNALIYPGQILQLPDASAWNYSMPCQIRTISWVNVDIRGTHLIDEKTEFEKIIRNVLRKEVPSLLHEVREYGALWSEVSYDESNEKFLDIDVGNDKRFIERSELICGIWSSMNEDPAALHLLCELSGWGDYEPTIYDQFRVEALGTAIISRISDQAETMLQDLVSTIAGRLISHREKECPLISN